MSGDDDKNEAWGFGGEPRPANDSARPLDPLDPEALARRKEVLKAELRAECFKRDTTRLRTSHLQRRKLAAHVARGRRE